MKAKTLISKLDQALGLFEAKLIYYHGTTDKFAREILKKGFVPDPKKKVWSQEKGSLESFYGTYLTRDWFTAYTSASTAREKFGGNRIIFEVQIETRTGLFDEDELPNMMTVISSGGGMAAFSPYLAAKYKETPSELSKLRNTAIAKWINGFNSYQQFKLGGKQKAVLRPLLGKWFDVVFDEVIKQDTDSLRIKSTPAMRKSIDTVVKALKSQLARAKADEFTRMNVRIDFPITFRGANRILSATTIDEIDYYKDFSAGVAIDARSPVKLKAVYGKVGKEFEKSYDSRIGSNYKVV